MNKRLKILLTICILLAVLSGCTASYSDAAAQETVSAPASQPTAAPTPAPTQELTPEPTLAPTPEPTPVPTTQPTPTPWGAPEGAEVVAEGFYYMPLNDDVKARITGISYPAEGEECRISYDDLMYIGLKYVDFDGETHAGEMIVNEQLAREVTEVFVALFEAEYPLASVRLVSDYGEPHDDNLSMEANNTSAFNYRQITGSRKLSRHSYGAAIDINPVQNPYIDGDRVAPPNAQDYVDRSLGLPGMIDHDDLAYRLLTERGWTWGGDWRGDKDYQHFSKDLGF